MRGEKESEMARVALFKLGLYARRILKTGILLFVALTLAGSGAAIVPMAIKTD